jgi:3-oxoacyl-[acyl-carrier protein] reductase
MADKFSALLKERDLHPHRYKWWRPGGTERDTHYGGPFCPRRNHMTLENKNAVLYGVGESLGGAVARTLAEAGAKVFLTARRLENARKVADEIRAAGGQAEADEVDALDEQAVNQHADRVVEMSGTLDVSFNLINLGERQGTPLVDMSADDFVRPVLINVTEVRSE